MASTINHAEFILYYVFTGTVEPEDQIACGAFFEPAHLNAHEWESVSRIAALAFYMGNS